MNDLHDYIKDYVKNALRAKLEESDGGGATTSTAVGVGATTTGHIDVPDGGLVKRKRRRKKERKKLDSSLDKMSSLSEAVRFGSHERDALRQNQHKIKVGVEYEFHVNPAFLGVDVGDDEEPDPDMESEVFDTAADRAEDKFRRDIAPFATIIYEIGGVWGDTSDVKEAISDAEDGDYDFLKAGIDEIRGLSKRLDEHSMGDSSTLVADFFIDVSDAFEDIIYSIRNMANNGADIDRILFVMKNSMDELETFFDFVEKTDASTVREVILNLIQQSRQESMEVWDMLISEFIDEVRSEVMAQHSPVNIVNAVREDVRGYSFFDKLERIEEDSSVPDGVEIVTKPLPLGETASVMEQMFDYIKTVGHTSDKTGMHVNISSEDFKTKDIDLLRLMVLMDSDFFQNSTSSKVDKYAIRNHMVKLNSELFSPEVLQGAAAGYVEGGAKRMEEYIRATIRPQKFRGINWAAMFHYAKIEHKRIEFRFFGGENYEKRKDEMMQDIMFISYVIIATTNKAYSQEYYKSLIRMLDRASERRMGKSFGDLIADARSNPKTSEIMNMLS